MAGDSGMMPASANAIARLRSGNWPDRGFIRAAAAALLAIELAISAFMVAGTHGWIVPLAKPTGTDFVSFYAAGALANAGTPELVYNLAAHAAAEEAATERGVPYQFFNYPPVFLLICGPLARLPYLAAFAVFEAATLALYLLVARRILGDPSGTALLVLVAFPLVFWTVGLGQNSFLTAALFGGATLLVDRRPIVAGLLFGALSYKPHYGLLVPFALAAGRCWWALAAAAVSVGALALGSLAAFGSGTWHDFFVTAGAAHALYETDWAPFYAFANPYGAVRQLGGSVPFAYALQGLTTLFAAALVVVVWRRAVPLPTRAAVLAAATPIAVPVSLYQDLMLDAIAGAWLIRECASSRPAGWEKTALACLYILALYARHVAEYWTVPVFPIAAAAVVAIAALRAWRERPVLL